MKLHEQLLRMLLIWNFCSPRTMKCEIRFEHAVVLDTNSNTFYLLAVNHSIKIVSPQ